MLYLVKARDHMKPIFCYTGDLYEMNAQPEKSVQHEACSLMSILHRQILFGTNITVIAFFQYHLAITIKYCQLWPVLLLSWIRNFPSGSTSGFTVDGYGMVFVGRCAAKERERERERERRCLLRNDRLDPKKLTHLIYPFLFTPTHYQLIQRKRPFQFSLFHDLRVNNKAARITVFSIEFW